MRKNKADYYLAAKTAAEDRCGVYTQLDRWAVYSAVGSSCLSLKQLGSADCCHSSATQHPVHTALLGLSSSRFISPLPSSIINTYIYVENF